MRLCHVTLFVSDIPRSRALYLALGFEPTVDESHYCRFLARGAEGEGDEWMLMFAGDSRLDPPWRVGRAEP